MKRLLIVLAMMVLLTACGAPKLAENPYGPEDFIYKEDYLTCTAGESRLGVDVSSHQGVIDWQAVADSGVEFAMIRIGFRGYQAGEINADTRAREKYRGRKGRRTGCGRVLFLPGGDPAGGSQGSGLVRDVPGGYGLGYAPGL